MQAPCTKKWWKVLKRCRGAEKVPRCWKGAEVLKRCRGAEKVPRCWKGAEVLKWWKVLKRCRGAEQVPRCWKGAEVLKRCRGAEKVLRCWGFQVCTFSLVIFRLCIEWSQWILMNPLGFSWIILDPFGSSWILLDPRIQQDSLFLHSKLYLDSALSIQNILFRLWKSFKWDTYHNRINKIKETNEENWWNIQLTISLFYLYTKHCLLLFHQMTYCYLYQMMHLSLFSFLIYARPFLFSTAHIIYNECTYNKSHIFKVKVDNEELKALL